NVPLLTNDGLIRGLAFAHETGSGSQHASAFARGVSYDHPSTPSVLLENFGHIQATASAYAHDTLFNGINGANQALASADARAVFMDLLGFPTELGAVHNSGGITANAHAFATGYDSPNVKDANASALARGVDQNIFAFKGTAIVTNYASGNITANALAHALAFRQFGDASSYATATAVRQVVENIGGIGSDQLATVKNLGGLIDANANALAHSTDA